MKSLSKTIETNKPTSATAKLPLTSLGKRCVEQPDGLEDLEGHGDKPKGKIP